MFGSSSNSRVKELEDELLETRLLYSCTLDDMDIVRLIRLYLHTEHWMTLTSFRTYRRTL